VFLEEMRGASGDDLDGLVDMFPGDGALLLVTGVEEGILGDEVDGAGESFGCVMQQGNGLGECGILGDADLLPAKEAVGLGLFAGEGFEREVVGEA